MKNVWIIGCLTEYVKHNVQHCKIANNILKSIFFALHTFWRYAEAILHLYTDKTF